MSMFRAGSEAHQKKTIDELLTLLQEQVAAAVRGNKLSSTAPSYCSPGLDESFDDLVRRFNPSPRESPRFSHGEESGKLILT